MAFDQKIQTETMTRQFENLVEEGKYAKAAALLGDIPDQKAALFITGLSSREALSFFDTAGQTVITSLLQSLNPIRLSHFLKSLKTEDAIKLCVNLPTNVIVDVLHEMDDEWRDLLFEIIPDDQRVLIGSISNYSEDQVGARMSVDFLSVRKGTSLEELRNMIKNASNPGKYVGHNVYVLDSDDHLLGKVSWKSILFSPSDSMLYESMDVHLMCALDTDSVVQAAMIFQQVESADVPVVNADGLLVGVLGLDVAFGVIAQEATVHTGYNGCFVVSDENVFTPVIGSVRRRLPWMALNVFLNLGAVALISTFEGAIEESPILAAFLPMITDMGGNTGIQSLSVAVRGIALGEATFSDLCSVIAKELSVGAINGTFLGVQFGVIVFLFSRNMTLVLCASIALGVNIWVACVVGGIFPFLLKRCGFDPAMMSGPLITTISDATGVAVYLGLATLLLRGELDQDAD
jgi:magnesium transporter